MYLASLIEKILGGRRRMASGGRQPPTGFAKYRGTLVYSDSYVLRTADSTRSRSACAVSLAPPLRHATW